MKQGKIMTTRKMPSYKSYVQMIRRRVDRDGITKVQNALGYRSPATIYTWLKNNAIPVTAIEKVKLYCHGGSYITGNSKSSRVVS